MCRGDSQAVWWCDGKVTGKVHWLPNAYSLILGCREESGSGPMHTHDF